MIGGVYIVARQKQDSILIEEFWNRIDIEIKRQNISKMQLAKRCRFDRKTLYNYQNYMSTPYFSRLCAELHVSADNILFGDERKGA